MRACTLGALHHRSATRTGAFRHAGKEALEHRRELLLDVGQREELLVQLLAAALAVPLKAIQFPRLARALDDQTHRVRWPLRRVRQAWGDEQHFAGADRYVHLAPV